MADPMAILWHGSPARFSRFEQRHERTRLDAYWTAADPTVAALYAGAGGWVQGIALPAEARILDATGGHDRRPLHYLDASEVGAALGVLETIGWENPEDGMEPGDALRHFDQAIDEGMCWEGLMLEDIPGAAMRHLLQGLGYQAVLCHDSTEGIRYDIHERQRAGAPGPLSGRPGTMPFPVEQEALLQQALARPEGAHLRLVRDVVASIQRDAEAVPVLALLDADDARMVGAALAGQAVLHAYLAGRRLPETPLEELVALCRPAPAAPLRHP